MKARTLAFLVCASLLTAGCFGGGSKRLSPAEYRTKVAAVKQEADAAQTAVEQGLHATSVSALAANLKAFAKASDKVGKHVGKLKPPTDAVAANAELAMGEHDVADATRAVLTQIKKAPSVKAAVTIVQHSTAGAAAGQEVDHAIAALTKLGYSKGS